MENLLIEKFNEYFSKINTELNQLALRPEHFYITTQLLDRLERINRKTFSLNHFSDGPDQYSMKLGNIHSMTTESFGFFDKFVTDNPDECDNCEELRQLFFLMNDLFYQSHALLQCIYAES